MARKARSVEDDVVGRGASAEVRGVRAVAQHRLGGHLQASRPPPGYGMLEQEGGGAHGGERVRDAATGDVGDEQRALHGAAHRFQMNQNLVERHRHGVTVTQNHVSQAIANQDDVDACLIKETCGRIVVSC